MKFASSGNIDRLLIVNFTLGIKRLALTDGCACEDAIHLETKIQIGINF